MPSGSASVQPFAGIGIWQQFATLPRRMVVDVMPSQGVWQSFGTSSAGQVATGVADLVKFKLRHLDRVMQIVDKQGNPSFQFQRYWQEIKGLVETAVTVLATSELSQQVLLDRILAAEGIAAGATVTAESALTEVELQRLMVRVRDSQVIGSPLSAGLAGSTATITIGSHQRRYLDPDVTYSVTGATLTGAWSGQTRFVYYDDPALMGGTVAFGSSENEADAIASLANPTRHALGPLVIPSVDGGTVTGDYYFEPFWLGSINPF